MLRGAGYQRKRTPQMADVEVGSWGAVVNPSTGRALVHVASGGRRIELSDWGVDGGHLCAYNRVVLAPRGAHEMVTWLALAGSWEEAKRYEVMGQ